MGDDNTATFTDASAGHITLLTYKMFTPVAEIEDSGNFLVYAQDDNGAEFLEVPAAVVDSYTANNKVDLASLNSESIAQYQLGAARLAMAVLPEEAQIDVVTMGDDLVTVDRDGLEAMPDELPAGNMDIVDVQRQISGNFDASTANDYLVAGDLVETIRKFRVQANNTPGGQFDLEAIDKAYQAAEIALDLPGYSEELKQAVQEGAAEFGITEFQIANITDVIENGIPENPLQSMTLD